ncbi:MULTISPECIES: DUF2997 domain-containing protein [Nostoc]|uniref:DUF2997 domain-containing protein n=1 Tax=Nostoc paludosum FACHB-159 TaxID=2692908 RepID=A0ABR8KJQ2_9NOSO|nr:MULTISPECIES: DUF2997 domain-containing protein [Nostoc]MBD2683495.1 DUF2997 domain-containing protein [Nostoc sp. FACHB-857]MBD2739819.1 DUF2997 domain-containing protein [Nostoc paludosum FACHB-159]
MERSVLIHFDSATGEVRVEAEGFEGLTCLSATQPFEEALGIVEGDRTFKEESAPQLRTTNSSQTRLHQ